LDRRPLYAAGDFLGSIAVGIVAALIAWALVGPGWNMWAAMFAMMALGMIVGLASFFLLGRWLGAMESMIPAMYTGMWSGMVTGMIAAMMPMGLAMRHAIELGAACGVGEIVFIWIANTILRGVSRPAKEG
jgi:hypothetical protein